MSRTQRLRADTVDTINTRDSTAGVIPIALSTSLSPSSSTGTSRTPDDDYFDILLPKTTYTPVSPSSSTSPFSLGQSPTRRKDDPRDRRPTTPSTVVHQSLLPDPLTVRQQQRKRNEEEEVPVVSGWWGTLGSFIYKPKGEYDPNNVV
ncbi:hypothetical protein QBC38DRAFT_451500 [Podospora fimiseda]|uniref:Uncharacterized protein n=1 Tax=Podospora fimiseda TaxID=252190 RepID=A0AAN7H7H6_9PEZI|nr:hypothetical protein QBC38DRAFT_451500 [Podospora fimiseda]